MSTNEILKRKKAYVPVVFLFFFRITSLSLNFICIIIIL